MGDLEWGLLQFDVLLDNQSGFIADIMNHRKYFLKINQAVNYDT